MAAVRKVPKVPLKKRTKKMIQTLMMPGDATLRQKLTFDSDSDGSASPEKQREGNAPADLDIDLDIEMKDADPSATLTFAMKRLHFRL